MPPPPPPSTSPTDAADDPRRLRSPVRIAGRYDPLRPRGRGSGTVGYACRDRLGTGDDPRGRLVTLKVVWARGTPPAGIPASSPITARGKAVPSATSATSPETLRAAADELFREYDALNELDLPGLPRVLDVGHDPVSGATYLAIEHIEGRPLAHAITRGPARSVAEFAPALLRIADALASLHAAGVVHGDVKPGNVIVPVLDRGDRSSPHGANEEEEELPAADEESEASIPLDLERPVLIDFGLARRARRLGGRSRRPSPTTRDGGGGDDDSDATAIIDGETETGLSGTLAFLAPERFDGHAPTPAADVYAFGVLAFAVLAGGALPFPGRGFDDYALAHREAPVPALPELDAVGGPIPPAWDALIRRCLAKEPTERPSNGHALAKALAPLVADATGSAAAGDVALPPLPPSPFTNRDTEIAKLERCLQRLAGGENSSGADTRSGADNPVGQAKPPGSPQTESPAPLVAVVGPPGAGKRRLVRETVSQLRRIVVTSSDRAASPLRVWWFASGDALAVEPCAASLSRLRAVVRADLELDAEPVAADIETWLGDQPTLLVLAGVSCTATAETTTDGARDGETVAENAELLLDRQLAAGLAARTQLHAVSCEHEPRLGMIALVDRPDETNGGGDAVGADGDEEGDEERDDDASARTAIPAWLDPPAWSDVVVLRGLECDDAAELWRATLGLERGGAAEGETIESALPLTVRAWLDRLHPAQPGLLRDALAAAAAEGFLEYTAGRWRLAAERDLGELVVPRLAERAAAAIAECSEPARIAAYVAATCGSAATSALVADVLAAVLDLAPNDAARITAAAIDELRRRRLVATAAAGGVGMGRGPMGGADNPVGPAVAVAVSRQAGLPAPPACRLAVVSPLVRDHAIAAVDKRGGAASLQRALLDALSARLPELDVPAEEDEGGGGGATIDAAPYLAVARLADSLEIEDRSLLAHRWWQAAEAAAWAELSGEALSAFERACAVFDDDESASASRKTPTKNGKQRSKKGKSKTTTTVTAESSRTAAEAPPTVLADPLLRTRATWRFTRALDRTPRVGELADRLARLEPQLAEHGDAASRELGRCLLLRAALIMRACDWDATEATATRAADIFLERLESEKGDPDRDREPLCEALVLQAMAWMGRNDYDRTLDVLDRAAHHAKDLPPRAAQVMARVEANRGHVAWARADYPTALACVERAKVHDETAGNERGMAVCLSNIGLMRHNLGDLDGAVRAFAEAEKIYRRRGMLLALSNLLNSRAALTLGQGRVADAIAQMREGLRLCEGRGEPDVESIFHANLAAEDIEAGEFARAHDHLERGLRLADAVAEPLAKGAIAEVQGDLAAVRGDLADAVRKHSRACEQYGGGRYAWQAERVRLRLALMQATFGDAARARATLAETEPLDGLDLTDPGQAGTDLALWHGLALGELGLAAGAWADAAFHYSGAVERSLAPGNVSERRVALPVAARFFVFVGEVSQALALIAKARQVETVEDSPLARARLDLIAAEAEHFRGKEHRARTLAASALDALAGLVEKENGGAGILHGHARALMELLDNEGLRQRFEELMREIAGAGGADIPVGPEEEEPVAAGGENSRQTGMSAPLRQAGLPAPLTFAPLRVADWLTCTLAHLDRLITATVKPATTASDDGETESASAEEWPAIDRGASCELVSTLSPLANARSLDELSASWLERAYTLAARLPWPELARRLARARAQVAERDGEPRIAKRWRARALGGEGGVRGGADTPVGPAVSGQAGMPAPPASSGQAGLPAPPSDEAIAHMPTTRERRDTADVAPETAVTVRSGDVDSQHLGGSSADSADETEPDATIGSLPTERQANGGDSRRTAIAAAETLRSAGSGVSRATGPILLPPDALPVDEAGALVGGADISVGQVVSGQAGVPAPPASSGQAGVPAPPGSRATPAWLADVLDALDANEDKAATNEDGDPPIVELDEMVDRLQRAYLKHVLELVDGNKSEAARLLRVERSRLYRLLSRLGVS